MENEEHPTVESIDAEIAELRQSQPANKFRHGTIEQKQYQAKKRALYQQKRDITNAENATNSEPEPGGPTLETLDRKIKELKADRAYSHPYEYPDSQARHRDLKSKVHSLYQQRQRLLDAGHNSADQSINSTQTGSLNEQARAELELLQELGIDTTGEDISEVSQAEVSGYRRVRLIEQGNFDELSRTMPGAARKAGYGVLEVTALRGFLRTKFAGNNDLKKKILRIISEDIYGSESRA
jgi:hypothetical protein